MEGRSEPDAARLPLEPWGWKGSPVRTIDGGLINDTFAVGAPPVAVLQRLHSIFDPKVNEDIAVITAHLHERGMETPRLLYTLAGDPSWLDPEGACWRALSWIPNGHTHHRLTDPSVAREAGALVGRWHLAVSDLRHTFAFSRPGAHDTETHMRMLQGAIDDHRGHRLHEEIATLGAEVLDAWARWDGQLDGALQLCHGDLKISNLCFDADDGSGRCLLDLDTMGWLPIEVELGDAWRSWCNPAGEDTASTRFDVALFSAAARGYLDAHPLPKPTRDRLPAGIERICLELCARFLRDGLEERYFGWSAAVAASQGEHNLIRALGQWNLYESVHRQRADLDAVLRKP